jgi:hypothetical protein
MFIPNFKNTNFAVGDKHKKPFSGASFEQNAAHGWMYVLA